MIFNSFEFVGLVLATFCLYYTPQLVRFQTLILIIASLIFYAFNQPYLVILLLFSCTINTLASYKVHYGTSNKRKLYAIAGVCFNLGVLAFFKYSSLFSKTFLSNANSIAEFLLAVPLPVGISFFTFQGISLGCV